jgi:hypothetical protein
MVTIEQKSAFLAHPFVLVLVGVAVSSIPLALLTHWLENRRKKQEIAVEHDKKELEIKVDIVSKMAEVIRTLMGESIFSKKGTKDTLTDADEEALLETLRKFTIDVHIISIKLESYISGTDIRERRGDYFIILISYSLASLAYTLKDPTTSTRWENSLKVHIDSIRKYFPNSKTMDWDRLMKEMR